MSPTSPKGDAPDFSDVPPPELTLEHFDAQEGIALLSLPMPPLRRPSELTPAEWEIVQHVAEGQSNAEIATHRRCSTRTVANHLQNIFRKLNVTNRVELLKAL